MLRGDDARVYTVRENPRAPQLRHTLIQARDVREAAAEHGDVGVENIDDARERFRQAPHVALDRVDRAGIALRCEGSNLARGERGCAAICGLQSAAAQECLDASGAAA